jgi:hypothetical protein
MKVGQSVPYIMQVHNVCQIVATKYIVYLNNTYC